MDMGRKKRMIPLLPESGAGAPMLFPFSTLPAFAVGLLRQ
jgi:hypothetical protein